MVRPTTLLRAAEGSERALASGRWPDKRPERNARAPAANLRMQTVGRLRPEDRPSNLLIHEVPRTALPSDLLRALRDSGAVGPEFPITNITSPPPSYPRRASLTKTFHLTTPSPSRAADIHRLLSVQPLFASSNTVPSPFYPRPSGQSSSTSSYVPREAQRITYTDFTPSNWVKTIIQSDSVGRSRPSTGDESEEKDGLTFGRTRSGGSMNVNFRMDRGGREASPLRREAELPTAEWALQAGLSGRRVVIKGLPGMIPNADVRKLAKGCGLEHSDEACKRLPPSENALVSTFVLTTSSVAMAYKLARKLHMNHYLSTIYGEKFMMRAEVAW